MIAPHRHATNLTTGDSMMLRILFLEISVARPGRGSLLDLRVRPRPGGDSVAALSILGGAPTSLVEFKFGDWSVGLLQWTTPGWAWSELGYGCIWLTYALWPLVHVERIIDPALKLKGRR